MSKLDINNLSDTQKADIEDIMKETGCSFDEAVEAIEGVSFTQEELAEIKANAQLTDEEKDEIAELCAKVDAEVEAEWANRKSEK